MGAPNKHLGSCPTRTVHIPTRTARKAVLGDAKVVVQLGLRSYGLAVHCAAGSGGLGGGMRTRQDSGVRMSVCAVRCVRVRPWAAAQCAAAGEKMRCNTVLTLKH